MSLSQISLVVDTVPDMPPAVVQARADEGEWSPALVKSESCAHESPVAKQVGLRHARSEEVVGPIRIRVLHVLILARGCRRPRVSVLRRSLSFGIVHSLDFAKLAAHLLVPCRRPVLPLVLLQPVLGTVNGGRSARGRRHVFQRRGRFLPGAGSTGTAIPATERVSAVEPEYIFPAEIEHDQHQLIGNINLIGQSTVQNKWKPSAINSTANGIRPRSSVPTANGIRPHSGIYHLMISRDIILILISSDMSGRRSGMIPFVHFA